LRRLAKKTLDKALDAVFGEQNDSVIGLSSMKGVRNGAYPKLKIAAVPCDHFSYYSDPQAQAAIKEWIAELKWNL
jgi:hypothetical protein